MRRRKATLNAVIQPPSQSKNTNDGPSGKTAATDSQIRKSGSTSDVISFKITPSARGQADDNSVSSSDFSDDLMVTLEASPVPVRASTPAVTDRVPNEFDDLGVQMVQDLLKRHHPDVAGLEFVGLGQYGEAELPKFANPNGIRFVQIISVGDHWLCVTNIFGASSHDVYVYDSLQRKKLSDNAVVQISAILRDDCSSENITVHVRKFTRQPARSRACGLYAAAAAFACCNREDPTGMSYDVELLRDSLTSRLINNNSDSLPGVRLSKVQDISLYKTRKVYCICHRRWTGKKQMIQCSGCGHWFHANCIGDVPSEVLQNTAISWTGPCCEQVA